MTELQKGNLSQYQMVLQIWKKFSEWSNIKPIIFISQNGFRFDEEMLRHSFYMNLLPVFMTNTGGNCRCDSLHIFKSTAIFRPGLLKIPSSNGKMTLALEAMAKENNLPHLAHNALGDCTVLVKLLKIIADADPDFFKQLITNKVFDGKSMYGLICYTFGLCLELGSPARDCDTKAMRDEVISLAQTSEGTFANIVPLYIKNINKCIDLIYEDIHKLLNPNKQANTTTNTKQYTHS